MIDWSKLRSWLIANTPNNPKEYLQSFEKDCGKAATLGYALEVWYDRMRPKSRDSAKRVALGWTSMDPALEDMGLGSNGKLFPWATRFLYPRAKINPPEDLALREAGEMLTVFRQTACAAYVSNPKFPKQFLCSVCEGTVSGDHCQDIRELYEKHVRLLEAAAIQYAKRMEKLERPRGRKFKGATREKRM